MLAATSIDITDAEWEVMRVVWANKSVTSRQIINILGNKQQWKEGTIKTLLGRLVDKEALQTTKEGRKFIYSAAVTEAESMDTYTEEVLSRVCNKQSGQVIHTMIDGAKLSKSDVTALKELLEQKERTALDEVPCECVAGQCECHLH